MKNRTILLTLILACMMLWSCDTKTKNVDNCGNNFIDPGEACDGTNLQEQTCGSLGHYNAPGTLRCMPNCVYDRAECGGRCGDEDVNGSDGEECDGGDLNGQSCQSLGYGGGTLTCGNDCQYDIANCAGHCGDGQIQSDEGEVCDSGNLAGETCQTMAYYGGVLACGADCQQLDLTDCEAVGRCGDGLIQTAYGEQCEGANLNEQTCLTLEYGQASGALSCTAGCVFNEAACVPKSTNADLSTLTVSEGTLSPAFSPSTTSYTVRVPLAVTSLAVTATKTDIYASLVIAPAQPMTLVEGDNPATVTVTAESGVQKVYSVVITREMLDYESPNVGTLKYFPTGTFQRDATVSNLSVVSAFRMGKYEITRAQWVAVTGWADPTYVTCSTGTDDPVQQVSWYDAIAFCNKLSLLEGLTPVYAVNEVNFTTLTYALIPSADNATWNSATANWAANGYRLPTEMEWMWAATGADTAAPGVTNTTGYLKAFAGSTGSNAIDDYAWYATNSESKTHPAGTKLPNELGLYDMSGNVYEWVWDWYGPYPTGTQLDYRGLASGVGRVLRGGGWGHAASYCTVALPYGTSPYNRGLSFGFRVVRP